MLFRRNGSQYNKVYWVAGQQKYCREVKVDGKRTYVPYDPQPSPESIIVVDRYYATLAANPKYRRRVSWLVSNDDGGRLAVYEYFGQHVVGEAHGNAKQRTDGDPFVRTPAATRDKITDMINTNRPQDVYNQLIVDSDVATAPRDSRVVRNTKAAVVRSQKAANGQAS